MDLFAGVRVSDLAAAVAWYERLFGSPPSFYPNDREAVWKIGEQSYVFVEVSPKQAGHSRHLLFVDDFDARTAQIADRGLTPSHRETLDNGVRKATYVDSDGNAFEFGGGAP